MFLTKLLVGAVALTSYAHSGALAFTSYANEFVDPNLLMKGSWDPTVSEAAASIVTWADQFAALGPWSVMSKPFAGPTGNKHDYLSWGPYYWPDCSKAGNTTALTDQEIWVKCEYVTRDGQFNPDVRLVNDTGGFQAMSDAVFYNTMAWKINGTTSYATEAVELVKTWFLNNDTAMTPNLQYAQVKRGPGVQIGQHTGVLDLKCMAKVASAILMLRLGKSEVWTTDIDTQFIAWINQYIHWLETSPIALAEKAATNNHGSFYFTQLAALKLIVNDTDGAKQVVQGYFSGIYLNQIDAKGDQPLETARTRPYHYRAYNLNAMITTAKIGSYLGLNMWNTPTKAGTNIQSACNYAMTLSASASNEPSYADELYPQVAAVAAHYGDPDGKYAKYLKDNTVGANGASAPNDGGAGSYVQQAYFFWDQPFSDSGLVGQGSNSGSGSGKTTTSGGSGSSGTKKDNGVAGTSVVGALFAVVPLATSFLVSF